MRRYLVVIRVLAFVSSGVMISINSIDVHIGHESSVGVYLAKRSRIYRIESAAMVSVMFVLLTIGGGPVGLVLVFAATRSEMALRSVFCLMLVLVFAATRKEMALRPVS